MSPQLEYDQSTGQVYKEWIVSGNSAAGRHHGWNLKQNSLKYTSRPERGPRSLLDQVIEVVTLNAGYMTDEHLERVPSQLLLRLWRSYGERLPCLEAWKLLSKRLLVDEEKSATMGLYRFRHQICEPGNDLKLYTQPMTSLAANFITHLVLSSDTFFTANELLCLAGMKNLGVLELTKRSRRNTEGFPQVDNRLIRGWTETDNPFPLLRILRIWGGLISQDSLLWLSKLPSLMLFDVIGPVNKWKTPGRRASESGWIYANSYEDSDPEDSLFHHILLLAPEEARARLGGKAREIIDANLRAVCKRYNHAIRFVANDETPQFLRHLSDRITVMDEPKSMTRVPQAPNDQSIQADSCCTFDFETWAFWLYALIGQLTNDSDLQRMGIQLDRRAVSESFVLPSRPMASLYLGHEGDRPFTSSAASYRAYGIRRCLFTRQMGTEATDDAAIAARKHETAMELSLRTSRESQRPLKRKKANMEDVWKSILE